MRYRIPKRFNRLSRKRPAAVVGNRDGGHHRNAASRFQEILFESKQGRLCIEGIEDSLSEQQVHTAVDQTARLLVIGIDERVEGRRTKRRIIHVGRH